MCSFQDVHGPLLNARSATRSLLETSISVTIDTQPMEDLELADPSIRRYSSESCDTVSSNWLPSSEAPTRKLS